jgi:hypothetical protein
MDVASLVNVVFVEPPVLVDEWSTSEIELRRTAAR